jgi:hypothetical protein
MHVHNKYLLPSLLAAVVTMAACSHAPPPAPAAQKGSVASSFGTQDTAPSANVAPPPPAVIPTQPGQPAFGPGPKPGFERTSRPAMLTPEATERLAQLKAKAQAHDDEAAKREIINGQATPPPPLPPGQGH